MLKKIATTILVATIGIAAITGCSSPADVASENVSKQADQFKVLRRIVFYNGITDKYILSVTGFCSLGNFDAERELTVTCKVGEEQFKKHFLGLSDNVTYVVEQIESIGVSTNRYEVIFQPTTIIPEVTIP